ncbi:MAG: PAS domain S-box protein [Acidobacteria bacterium]|nr:PAS domain S-box protein [Acidobacteriota bacterium]
MPQSETVVLDLCRRLFGQAGEAVFLLRDGRVAECSEAFPALLGCRRNDLLGRDFLRLTGEHRPSGHTPSASLAYSLRAAQDGYPQNIVVSLATAGGPMALELSLGPADLPGAPAVLGIARRPPGEPASGEVPRQSDEGLRAIFNKAMDGFLLADVDTRRFRLGNDAICRMLGYTPEEILTLGVEDIHPEKDLPTVVGFFDRQARGEIKIAPDVPLKRKDGTVLYADINSGPVLIGDQRYLLGIFRDNTEHHRQQEQLRRSEREWWATFQAIGHPTLLMRPDHTILAANRSTVAALGMPEADLVGRKCHDLFHPGVPDPPDCCPLGTVVSSGKLETQDMEIEALGGTYLVSCTPLLDEGGKVDRVLHIATDITVRKRAEHDLRKSEQRFRTILDSLDDAVLILDARDYRILDVNHRTLEMHGFGREEVLDLAGADLGSGRPPFTREEAVARLRQAADGAPQVFEWEGRHRSGDVFPIEVNVRRAIIDEQERLLVVVRDVSERKRWESEREKLQQQLVQAQKLESIGRLAGGVAHDFSNLLTVILGYAEILLRDPASRDQAAHGPLTEIQMAGERARHLTRQLLAFGRKQELRMEPVDLNEVVRRFNLMLARLLGENIEIEIRLSPAIGLIRADVAQVEQVLMNLAVNARDAMPAGGRLIIETTPACLAEDADPVLGSLPRGDYVVLSVCDTGCGMDGETLKQVFEPFFTTKGKEQGTGLGLSMVYGIVKQHGGEIFAVSQPGAGAVFRIYLPVARPGQKVSSSLPTPGRGAEGGRGLVLVVEDDVGLRRLACNILSRHGYDVLEALDPQDAVRLGFEHRDQLEVVLSDVVMPGMNGPEVVSRIRGFCPGVRTVFMSGYTEESIRPLGVRIEGISFVAKPFTPKDLVQAVREARAETAGPLPPDAAGPEAPR